VSGILAQAGRSDLLSSGFRCVLSGPVNVGKSSLYNRLLERNRAIVTGEPGTTRDVLEGTLEIGGIPVTLVDTAGLREPTSRPEVEGTRRSMMERESADLLLEVRDASQPAGRQEQIQGKDRFEGAEAGTRRLVLLNKVDLGIDPSWEDVMSRSGGELHSDALDVERDGAETGPGHGTGASPLRAIHVTGNLQEESIPVLAVSALDGTGIGALREEIARHFREAPGEEILLNLRQRTALQNAVDNLASAGRSLRQGELPEIVSFELGEAAREVGGILGRDPSDELLDAIFSRFCIGK
jgi:tRNA modification GTPase